MRAAGVLTIAIAAVLLGAAAPAAGPARCGGFVRQIAGGDVELAVRGQRIEVRLRDAAGAPINAEGTAAFAGSGEAQRVVLHRAEAGLLVGDAPQPITARTIMLRLVFNDGVVGAARFPVRRATCAAASAQTSSP